jgi:hypothetical protein
MVRYGNKRTYVSSPGLCFAMNPRNKEEQLAYIHTAQPLCIPKE